MEAKRQLDVLDKQLARGRYVAGEEYTIADMAVWPWYGNVVLGNVYNAAEFLDAGSYKNVLRWAQMSATARPSSADASSTAPTARSMSSCMSAMMPATLTPKRKISARRKVFTLSRGRERVPATGRFRLRSRPV